MNIDPGMRGQLFKLPHKPSNTYKLPSNILGVICGPSMSGKTTYILNLILNTIDPETRQIIEYSVLNPDIIYIFAPTIDQELYQTLFKFKNQVPTICADIVTFDSLDKLPDPSELDPDYERKCIIIDDAIVLKNQDKLVNYFTKGRHYGLDTFYLTQRFYEVPMLIRDQLNMVISFNSKPETYNALYHMSNTHMSLPQFKNWAKNRVKDGNGHYLPKVIVRGIDPELRDGIVPPVIHQPYKYLSK